MHRCRATAAIPAQSFTWAAWKLWDAMRGSPGGLRRREGECPRCCRSVTTISTFSAPTKAGASKAMTGREHVHRCSPSHDRRGMACGEVIYHAPIQAAAKQAHLRILSAARCAYPESAWARAGSTIALAGHDTGKLTVSGGQCQPGRCGASPSRRHHRDFVQL